jgi:3-oxoacid CoA-transferase subunit A
MKKKNKLQSLQEAISHIKSGSRIMVGGFGLKGTPHVLVDALADSGVKDLTIISNDLGGPGEGLGRLLRNGQVKGLVGNFYNWNPEVATAYFAKEIQVQLVPQGTFAEAMRAAGAGIPAFYTPTGVGTELSEGKETRIFGGRTYLLVEAIPANFALIEAYKADTLGNLIYYKTARNFNSVMAMAGKFTIVQVAEIV